MRRVFVDTSAFVAIRSRGEREHLVARKTLSRLLEEGAQLFSSNYVFSETYTALLVRTSRDEAIAWGRALRSSDQFELVTADEAIEEEAWTILETHQDKRWSYVDATSFAILGREMSAEAFSFDSHFVQRGLRTIPTQR